MAKLGEVSSALARLARPCWRKQRWHTKGAAEAQLRSLLRREYVKDVDRLNTYKCGHCKGFHVGRRKRKEGI